MAVLSPKGLSANLIADRVIKKLDSIGIRSKVGGKESETAALVRLIVQELVFAIQAEAIVNTVVTTTGSPNVHQGFGKGKIK